MRGEMRLLVARVGLFDVAVLAGGLLVGGGPSWAGNPWARVGLGAVLGLAAGVLLADAAWAWCRRQATAVMRRQAALTDHVSWAQQATQAPIQYPGLWRR